MNSLSDLNSYGSTTVSYTDSREPNLKFDRPSAVSSTISLEQKDSHSVLVGINVIEVIQPASVAATYTIDLSAASGNATITAGSLPSGVSMTNPSTGVYVFSGWDSVSDWNSIRSPQIDLAIGYTGSFTYTATIAWYGSNSLSWTVAVTVSAVVILEDPAPATYFTTSATNLLTAPEILTNKTGTYTVTITPSQTTYISTMASAIADPTPICSFNNTTKVMTLTGSLANVKTYLAQINVTYTSSATANFSYTYDLTSTNPDASADTVTQTATVQSYITQPSGNGVYVVATATDVTNQPQITNNVADPYSDIENSYTLTVTPQDASIISSISADSWYSYSLSTSHTVDPATSGDGGTNTVWQTKISPMGSKMIVFSGDDATTPPDYTYLYEYSKSAGTWTLNQTLTDDIEDFGSYISINYSSDDSILVIGDRANGATFSPGKITVFQRSSGTLSSIATISGTDNYNYLGEQVAINSDATKIVSNYANNSSSQADQSVKYYTRSGSTITLAQTITNSDNRFGSKIVMSSDGNYLAIASETTNGTVRIYELSAGSYTLQATLTGTASGDRFGESLWINGSGNSLWVGVPGHNSNQGKIVQYGRSGSTWSVTNTITHPSAGDTDYNQFGGNPVDDSPSGIQASSDGLYVAAISSTSGSTTGYPVTIFKVNQTTSQWEYHSVIFVAGTGSWSINDSFTEISGTKISEAANKFWLATPTTNTGSLSADKVLTLTANKTILNRLLQTVSVTTVSGITWNFNLTYGVTTPASASGSSTQLIEPQGT